MDEQAVGLRLAHLIFPMCPSARLCRLVGQGDKTPVGREGCVAHSSAVRQVADHVRMAFVSSCHNGDWCVDGDADGVRVLWRSEIADGYRMMFRSQFQVSGSLLTVHIELIIPWTFYRDFSRLV